MRAREASVYHPTSVAKVFYFAWRRHDSSSRAPDGPRGFTARDRLAAKTGDILRTDADWNVSLTVKLRERDLGTEIGIASNFLGMDSGGYFVGRMRVWSVVVLVIAAIFAGHASAALSVEPFAKDAEFVSVKVSPNGDRLGVTMRVDGRVLLNVIQVAGMKTIGTFGVDGGRDVEDFIGPTTIGSCSGFLIAVARTRHRSAPAT